MRLGASLHFGERQRRSDLQPRVAPQALPWVSASERTQPQRGCGGTARHPGRNPFRVEGHVCQRPRVVAALQPWAGGRNAVGVFVGERAGLKPESSSAFNTRAPLTNY